MGEHFSCNATLQPMPLYFSAQIKIQEEREKEQEMKGKGRQRREAISPSNPTDHYHINQLMGPNNINNGRDGSSSSAWSVFDTLKAFPPTPEALMAEIDSAISISEYNHSTSLLHNAFTQQRYDARLADQAYKSGCAALAAGNLDEALRHLQTSLSLCPPDKTSAVTKLRSLTSFVSQQKIQKPPTT